MAVTYAARKSSMMNSAYEKKEHFVRVVAD
ncbi:unnamed protein product [Gongylonema pulchrum]|uniref:50S ribosomal protein L23 n=1 Tax=Gongylonema pulchrum TaxID=637853 RepID=A0A183DFY1_9BILA|nr:unnamed protein product [Gongylonema pulchrum]